MSDPEPRLGGEPDPAPLSGVENASASTTANGDDASALNDDSPNSPVSALFQCDPNDPLLYVETLKRLWAKSTTLAFLEGHLEGYRVARSQTYTRARDYIDTVTNEYFERVPWRNKVSDPIPDDFDPAVVESLTAVEEAQKACKIEAMKSSIKSWLDYRIDTNKLVGRPGSKENDVWSRLLKQLSGVPQVKPRKLSACQFWSKANYTSVVKPDYEARWEAEKDSLGSKNRSSFREKITAEHFGKLSADDQHSWGLKAKDAHSREVAQWKAALEAPVDTSPEARQRAIDHVQVFVSPILDEIYEVTGLHGSLLLGGPEPRKGGRINIISLHSGKNLAAVGQKWPAASPESYKAALGHFLGFVNSCYTTQMKEAAALKKTDESTTNLDPRLAGLIPLEGSDQNVNNDTCQPSENLRAPVPPAPAPSDLAAAGPASQASLPAATAPLPRTPTSAPSAPARNSNHTAPPAIVSNGNADLLQDKVAHRVMAAAHPPHSPASAPKSALTKKATARTMSSAEDVASPARKGKRKRGRRANSSDEDTATETDLDERNDSGEDTTPIQKVYNTRGRISVAQTDEVPSSQASEGTSYPLFSLPLADTWVVSLEIPSENRVEPRLDRHSGRQDSRQRSVENLPNNTDVGQSSVVHERAEHPTEAVVTTNDDPRVGIEGLAKTRPENLNLLDNGPQWIQHALEYLAAPDLLRAEDRRKVQKGEPDAIGDRQGWTLPSSYTRLLEEYLRLESSSSFSSIQGPAGTLDAKERPGEVAWWIARKRALSVRPSTKSVDGYARQWWKWWTHLQPEWRKLLAPSGDSSPESPLSRQDGDWTALDRPGINGFYSVIVALKWWGSEVRGASKDRKWLAAVDNVQWVMSCVIRSRVGRHETAKEDPTRRPAAKRQRLT
ncbi:hypothetical protein CONPUDRAFT_151501 [Coniophora puteana RWD-64-598 SS2]|uniref:Uncharacterized protein n=1 Tax=Coniophora puteana (strain RWD-64-598) TaxID=741705 RepID=A0A5M3MZ88_CONPW|nr:uncharacterized protein CONPUDRAFT_151501 [Coniophora puteana RWD-64-598 SS2]EIW84483.1 hypothetical protein CONPUDRAFT_151501 [Coniophora puteana RWD-64-598 SS2]